MAYVVYAHWVGMHKWGLNSHKDIEAIRSPLATGVSLGNPAYLVA